MCSSNSYITEIAADVDTIIFNEGSRASILFILNILAFKCGRNGHRYTENIDATRVHAPRKALEKTECYVGNNKLISWILLH